MATREQITDLINDCWYYFKVSTPPVKTIDSWVKELTDIDLYNAGDHLTRKFKMLNKFPENFPWAIKTIYRDWVRQQPKEFQNTKGCEYCLMGEGIIHAWKIIHGYKYMFSFLCSHCNSVENLQYPKSNRELLKQEGYTLDWQHDHTGVKDLKKLQNYYDPEPIPF